MWQGCTVKWIVCTVMCTMICRQKYIWTLTLLLLCFQGVHLYVFFPFVRVLVHSLLLVCKEISTGVFDIWITLGLVLFACNLCFLCFGKMATNVLDFIFIQTLWYKGSFVGRNPPLCELPEHSAPGLWGELLLWHGSGRRHTRGLQDLCCSIYDPYVQGG